MNKQQERALKRGKPSRKQWRAIRYNNEWSIWMHLDGRWMFFFIWPPEMVQS